jgi:hypothetical protein
MINEELEKDVEGSNQGVFSKILCQCLLTRITEITKSLSQDNETLAEIRTTDLSNTEKH